MSNIKDSELKIDFVFFGTPRFAVFALEEMEKSGLLPSLVVTAPDKPAGRGLTLTPPPVKIWAETRGIPVLQPEKLDSDFIYRLKTMDYGLFIVAAYGKIIPPGVLAAPKHGALNIHPSLLPKYRGASPLQSAILSGDKKTGVAIIRMDNEMDHGPVVSQKEVGIENMNAQELGEKLFRIGGQILAEIIPEWITGEIQAMPQDHNTATYTKKIVKENGRIDLTDDPQTNWRKFRAYHPWPGIFFFTEGGARVKITDATFESGAFVIKKVIPEGEKETAYEEFLKR